VTPSETEPSQPLLRVVKGDPSPEELAALIAVITARTGGGEAVEDPAPSSWADRSRGLRPTLTPGVGAWRASAFPR
jgi:hypothetical protein